MNTDTREAQARAAGTFDQKDGVTNQGVTSGVRDGDTQGVDAKMQDEPRTIDEAANGEDAKPPLADVEENEDDTDIDPLD